MELKVFKSTIAAYGGKWETKLELPLETELLIPDYLPAVFKIVKCLIEPVIMQNNITAAHWQGEGYLRCTVYYQSDEAGTRLYRCDQKFPFEKSVELPSANYVQGPARLWGEVEYSNCRAISEHRIDLRGAYTLCVAALAVEPRELLTSLADCGVEQRTMQLDGESCTGAEEKTFTAKTTLSLPGTGETVLDISGSFAPQGYTVQTGQVNIKGSLTVQACYRPADAEELSVKTKEIPVQQTVELGGIAEGDTCCCWGRVLACTLAAAEGAEDEPTLTITWALHAELWRAQQYMAVADAYSTLCQTSVSKSSCRLLQKRAELAETVNVVVEDELPDATARVKACFVTLGGAQATQTQAEAAEGEQVAIVGKGTAHLLCADERGELTCYDKAFAWQLPQTFAAPAQDLWPQLTVAATKVNSGKNGDKMRVDLEIAVRGCVMQMQSYEVADAVELGEEFPDKNEGPALYLYYATQGERVFDIAKRYHARAKDLAAANHMEPTAGVPLQDMTSQGACLLIPAAL